GSGGGACVGSHPAVTDVRLTKVVGGCLELSSSLPALAVAAATSPGLCLL
ncbi:unnamed protein product, partial [Urochloa humidicola]